MDPLELVLTAVTQTLDGNPPEIWASPDTCGQVAAEAIGMIASVVVVLADDHQFDPQQAWQSICARLALLEDDA